MATYALNSGPFLLKEGYVEIGLWTDPQDIAPAVDPNLSFTSDGIIGYFEQGTSKVALDRTYAEFLAGTPGKTVRMDLTLKKFSIEFMMAQFEAQTLALAQGLDVEDGNFTLGWIGNDEPVDPQFGVHGFNGYRITTALTDGNPFYIAVWYGKDVSEAVGWELAGTKHGTYKLLVRAFEHPNFTDPTDADDTHNYGMVYFDNTSTT